MSSSGLGLAEDFENIKNKITHIFSKGGKTSVGVDVGNSGVKIVELERTQEGIVLKNYAIANSGEELIKPGTAGVINSAAGPVVMKALEESGISHNKVNVAVPSFSSLITTIEIPQMPQNEIEQVVLREAPKYIPVQLSDVVYGWQVIEDTVDESIQKQEEEEEKENSFVHKQRPLHVLMVAIMKEISDQYDKVFSSSGLGVDSLEIDSFSLTRSLVGEKPGAFLVLDIGHRVCNIIAVSNKNILMNRTIDVAGDRITKIIAKAMNIDSDRAEKMKVDRGLDIDKEGTGMISQVLSVLTNEVKRTMTALAESYPNVKVGRIILSGGGARLKGLDKFLQDELKIETVTGNPLEEISYPDAIRKRIEDHSASLSIAVGLALLGFEDKG